MADIAFLLLIFFLVTTTMTQDKGIQRILPPISDNTDGIDVKERNTLMVHVNQYDQVMVAGKKANLEQIKDIAKEFVTNPTNDPNLPEKVEVEVPIFGMYPVSKGVISLNNDRGTSYDMYIKVQNELTRAFNEARDEFAKRTFDKGYNEVSDDQRAAINKIIKISISEAEPRNLAGKK